MNYIRGNDNNMMSGVGYFVCMLLPVAVFIILIGGLAVVSAVKPDDTVSVAENRELEQLPEISAESILNGTFGESYEKYISDQFPIRPECMAAKSFADRISGRKDINGIYIGSDGYMIERYTDSDFDKEHIDENVSFLSGYIEAMSERYGSEHVHAIFVPSKGSVLKEKLPPYAEEYDSSGIVESVLTEPELPDTAGELSTRDYAAKKDKAYEEVRNNVVTDLEKTLTAYKGEYIYYRNDHHWTTLGAFYAYKEYCRLCGLEKPDMADYTQTVVTSGFLGSSYDKVQYYKQADEITKWERRGRADSVIVECNEGKDIRNSYYYEDALGDKDKYRFFLGGNEARVHIHTSAGNGKTLLLIKDSFSNCFVEFLERDYEDIYMVDLRYTNDMIGDIMDSVCEENAITDVLVMFNREKFMQDNNMWQLEYEPEEYEPEEYDDSSENDEDNIEDDEYEEEDIF